MEKKIKLIWDFRGPSAELTAKHHEIHLKEYATIEKLTYFLTGQIDISDMHSIAFMVVNNQDMKKVRDALKPHRGQLYSE
ncbi:hypothetical protein ACJRPK_14590 [Aquimarina sp. 2-A2]|uniref:Uncharacterized protein n=1 Tax=Aquimarina intermedia TaxID=350814 RepID=A0A5S5C0T6_9FLAO|nr:hypothetical protein [Aquimarina intermedia]TYP72904.1 hypothetical protein BD809_106157 [Aquimarina intermedia]